MVPPSPLNPDAASPLYLQLQRTLRLLIQNSEWHPGLRLPAVPELAERFQVHRLTVLKALAGLKRTGWVQTVTGRGSFVADHLPEAPALRDPETFPFQGSALKVREDELGPWLGETLERAQNRMLVSFSAGFPPSDLLPGDGLRRLYVRTMKELDGEAWAYAAPAGHPSYLDAVSQWLADEGEPIPAGWGMRATPGAQAGLALVVESLTIPGDREIEERGKHPLHALPARCVGKRDDDDGPAGARRFRGLREPRAAHLAGLREHGIDARKQLGRMERFRQIVRGAAGQSADLIEHVPAGRQEDHRDVGGRSVALHLEADVVAVRVRQADIEQDQVRVALADECQAIRAGPPDGDGHPVRLQAPLEHIGRCRVVLDDDHGGRGANDGHRGVSPSKWRMPTTNLDGRSAGARWRR